MMGILLKVTVQDQLHGPVREFVDGPSNGFYKFCAKAEPLGVRNVAFIWPYTDSMLNFVQLAAWLEDIPRALGSGTFSDEEAASAAAMLTAAREAHAIDGYLLLEG